MDRRNVDYVGFWYSRCDQNGNNIRYFKNIFNDERNEGKA